MSVESIWVPGKPGSGEAPLDEAGPVLGGEDWLVTMAIVPGIFSRGALPARQPKPRAGTCPGQRRQDWWRALKPGPRRHTALARPAPRPARPCRLLRRPLA